MSALHYLLLFTILFSATSGSNLECVLESLNSFRQIKKPTPNSPNQRKTGSDILHDSISSLAGFFKGLGDSGKTKNGKFEPMTSEAVIQEFIAKESKVLGEKQRRHCDQICVPFVSEVGVEHSVAIYFCERIISAKSDAVKFFLDNSDVAGTYFGHAFQASALHLPASFFSHKSHGSETMVSSFAEKQKMVSALKVSLANYTTGMIDEIEKFYKVNIQDELITHFKGKLDLEKTVKGLLGKDSKNVKEKLTKLTLAFNANLNGNKNSHIKGFQNGLALHVTALKEDVSSQPFRSMLDRTVALVDPQYPTHSIQVENALLANCFETLSKFGVSLPVNTCRSIVQPAFELEGNLMKIFDNALESVKFFKMVNHFVQKSLMVFASNKLADIDAASVSLKKDIIEQLNKVKEHSDSIAKIYSAAPSHTFAPMIWDLMKFVGRYDKEAIELLRVIGAFERYHKQLLGNVHSSSKIAEIISDLKANLFKRFSTNKSDMKISEFRDKLVEECERQTTNAKLNICRKSVRAFKVEKDLLKLRHSNAIYKYIVTLLKETLDNLDTQLNEESLLIGAATETLGKITKAIESDFESLVGKSNAVYKNIKEKKLQRLFIQAKLTNLELRKNFSEDVWPICRAWIEGHAKYIAAYNLKDHSFEELADQLSEIIRTNFSEDLKLSKMKNSFDELRNSMEHKPFNPHSSEIADLKRHVYSLIKHYDSLPSNIKTELSKCTLSEEEAKHKLDECQSKNQRSCVTLNPLLATPTCPVGFVIDSLGNCIESCPEGFGPSTIGYCAKPNVAFVGAVLGKIATDASTKCAANFTKVGLMCVPRCPKNWEDHGKWCKRPMIKHSMDHDVLLIK
jgi:hypothetical protein